MCSGTRGKVGGQRCSAAPVLDTCGGRACAVVRIGWNHLIPRWVSLLEPATPDQLSYLRFDTTPLPAPMRTETVVLSRWLKRFPADGSDDDDLHESFQPVEITRVASKEGGVVRAGRCGNQQIRHPSAGLTTGFHYLGSQEPVAFSNCLVYR
jgi:hypothetical protein